MEATPKPGDGQKVRLLPNSSTEGSPFARLAATLKLCCLRVGQAIRNAPEISLSALLNATSFGAATPAVFSALGLSARRESLENNSVSGEPRREPPRKEMSEIFSALPYGSFPQRGDSYVYKLMEQYLQDKSVSNKADCLKIFKEAIKEITRLDFDEALRDGVVSVSDVPDPTWNRIIGTNDCRGDEYIDLTFWNAQFNKLANENFPDRRNLLR